MMNEAIEKLLTRRPCRVNKGGEHPYSDATKASRPLGGCGYAKISNARKIALGLTCLLGTWLACGADDINYVYGQNIWIGNETYSSTAQSFFSPTSGTAEPGGSVTFTAVPTNGLKVSGWYKMPKEGSKVENHTILQTGGNTYTWKYVSNAGSVRLALKLDWIKFNVKYDLGYSGGATPSEQKGIVYTNSVKTANVQNRPGYTFDRWYWGDNPDDSDCRCMSNKTYKAAGAKFDVTNHDDSATVTLKAIWKANTYQVTFDGNGGGTPSPASKSVTYDSTYGELPNCSRMGYTFAGWYTAKSGGTKVDSTTKVAITAGQTLYAHWTANSYTVTFNKNGGGTPSPATKSVAYDSTYGTLATCSRTGYTFAGWYTAASGGTEVKSTTEVTITAAQTLYAHWTANSYKVCYDANGGTGSMGETSLTYDQDGTLDGNAFSRTGYAFAGWATSLSGPVAYSDKSSVRNLTTEGTKTLYAVWSPLAYELGYDNLFLLAEWIKNEKSNRIHGTNGRVSADAEGGTVKLTGTKTTAEMVYTDFKREGLDTSGVVSYPCEGGKTYSLSFSVVSVATKRIWLFFYDKEGKYVDGGQDKYFSEDGTFVTPPGAAAFTVFFAASLANGQTATFSNIKICKSVPYAEVEVSGVRKHYRYSSGTYGSLLTPTRTGYEFGGWFTGEDGSGLPVTASSNVTASSRTVYSKWTARRYEVTFNKNGGDDPSEATRQLDYGQPYGTLPTCSRTGYAFAGWYTAASGGTEVKSTTKVSITAAQTLYAHWTANSYTVRFNANGGTACESTRTVIFDAPYGALPSAVFTGHTLTGWFTATSGGTQVYDTTVVKTAEEHTLYAQWHLNTYTVSFNGNGATSGSMQTEGFDYNEQKSLLPNGFVRTGYQFGGWNTQRDGKGVAYGDKESVLQLTSEDRATVTLYAQWSPIAYDVVFLPNGAKAGTMDAQHFLYDEAVALSSNRFVNGELRFLGWSCSNGKTYADGEVISNLTDRADVVITNTAMWAGTYHVAFDANGGAGEMAEMTFDDAVQELNLTSNAFVRTGYVFKGWGKSQSDADDGKNLLADGVKVKGLGEPGTTVTLYASWEAIVYYVAYSAGQGVVKKAVDVSLVHYDEPLTLPVVTNGCYESRDPAKYAFGGWTDGLTGAKYADRQTVSNLCTVAGATNTLTAVWKLDVGEWSEHMHCTTLRWGIDKPSDIKWTMMDGPTFGCTNTGMCVSQLAGNNLGQRECLMATVTTNGLLSFSCRREMKSAARVLLLVGEGVLDYQKALQVELNNGEWVRVEKRIELPEGSSSVDIMLAVFGAKGSDDDSVQIDQMVWLPDGDEPENPEPVPGVDNPTIEGVTLTNGKLTIRSSGDAKFGYRVLKSASLVAPISWEPLDETYQGGADAGQSFELSVDAAKPQMFYKVEVLKKR